MDIWFREFEASYIREDGVIVLHDADVPLPDGFENNPEFRSNVVFPPGTRAGDHYHESRHEVFVGFGEGMELLVQDRETNEVSRFKMDPKFHEGKCVVFWIRPGVAHAVRNGGTTTGYLVEFASRAQERVGYVISTSKR